MYSPSNEKIYAAPRPRVLILEDSDNDLMLIHEEIKKGILNYDYSRVINEKEFIESLKEFKPDIILADFCLPAYNGFLALDEVRKSNSDIPFIFVSGAIGEELAIEALRRGATDCVNKNHLGKLPSAIQRALAETDERRQRARAERALDRLRHRNSLILESAGEGILGLDGDLKITFINRAGLAMIGYDIVEITGEILDKIIPHEDHSRFHLLLHTLADGRPGKNMDVQSIDLIMQPKNGVPFPAECTISPITKQQNVTGYVFTIKDITERIKAREEIESGYKRLRKILLDSIHAMSVAIEFRDPYTAGHQMRVSDLGVAIAKKIGLSEEQINGIYLAGIVHDIGKIYVPAEILSKPSKLNEYEFNLMKYHPKVGYEILKDIDFPWPIAQVVFQHHERMDGSGYPEGLKGNSIILEARIISLADVVDAMASHRPYRPALGTDAALKEIKKGSGTIYDSTLVEACIHLFEEGFAFADSHGPDIGKVTS